MTPEPEITNIAAFLPRMARLQAHRPAIVFPEGRNRTGERLYSHYTFAQLDRHSDRIARGLEAIGIRQGTRTVLMVKPSLEFFALTFALFKTGAVPVLVDPGIGLKNLKTCLGEAEPTAFIGIPAAHAARVLLGWARGSVSIKVTVGRRLFWGGHTLEQVKALGEGDEPYRMAPTRRDDLAAILFTSGSTGVPKGAEYQHGNFIAQIDAIRETYDIQPGEIDLPTFPLFALFDPALGMTTIVPDMDPTRPANVDPEKIIEAIEDFGVTNMFGSPALLNTVGRYGEAHGIRLPTLRRVICAGAPVPASVMRRFRTMLNDDCEIVTPYGATESLPVASIGSHEVLGETAARTDEGAGVCVGKPVATITAKIIRIDDGPIEQWSEDLCLPVGEIGEIVVKGAVVTRRYRNRESSTKLAKIEDGDTFWHRMGDLGYFDAKGRLWFCGRKTHRVITRDATLFTVPCEAVFNVHDKVYRTALVGVGNSGDQKPVLCVELEKDAGVDHEQLASELLALGKKYAHTRAIDKVLFHPNFPVDIRHNAKIGRDQLARWAGKQA